MVTMKSSSGEVDTQGPGGREGWRRIVHAPEFSVLVALVVLAVVMGIAKPQSFLSSQNLFNILKGMSSIGVMLISVSSCRPCLRLIRLSSFL